MKKRIVMCFSLMSLAIAIIIGTMNVQKKKSGLLSQNVEALAGVEGLSETLGCSGGDTICFQGTVTFMGVKITGTWYTEGVK